MNNKLLWASFYVATTIGLQACVQTGVGFIDKGVAKVENGVNTAVGKIAGKGSKIDEKILGEATKAISPVYGTVSKAVKNGVDPRNPNLNKTLDTQLKQIRRSYGPEVEGIAREYITNAFDAKNAAKKGLPEDKIACELEARRVAVTSVAHHYVEKMAQEKTEKLKGKLGKALDNEAQRRIPFYGLYKELTQ